MVKLTQRGLPQTSDGFAYVTALTNRLVRLKDRVPRDLRPELEKLNVCLQNALIYLRPGGLFAAYAGFGGVDPLKLFIKPM